MVQENIDIIFNLLQASDFKEKDIRANREPMEGRRL